MHHFLSVTTKSEICALIGTLWFSFSNNVWEYATHFENFALNNLLCILLLYTYYSYLEQVVSDGNYVQRTNKELFNYGLILSGLALGTGFNRYINRFFIFSKFFQRLKPSKQISTCPC